MNHCGNDRIRVAKAKRHGAEREAVKEVTLRSNGIGQRKQLMAGRIAALLLAQKPISGALLCWELRTKRSTARSTSRSRKLSHCQSLSSCGLEKRAVASDHDDIRITDSVGSREVDCVIPAQLTSLSQLASSASEGVINFDQVHLLEQGVELGYSDAEMASCKAAKSLGMPHRIAMRRVVLPQATRFIIPPLGNEFNSMMKNSSLVFFIGVTELFGDAEIRYSTTFKPVEYFLAVAFWYLVLTSVWSVIQAQIERKLAVSERGDELSFRERVFEAWAPVSAWGRGAR